MKRILAFLLCIALCCGWLCGCSSAITMKRYTFSCFGSESVLVLYDNFFGGGNAKYQTTVETVAEMLNNIDKAVSVSNADSDISKFNALAQNQSIEISNITYEILTIAKNAYEQTNGAYDPTVLLCCDLWGLTSRFFSGSYTPQTAYDRNLSDYDTAYPNEEYLNAFKGLIDFSAVELSADGKRATKLKEGVQVGNTTYYQQMDLGGVAKGYAVDKVMEYLKSQGYIYGYFSCGTSSVGLLSNYNVNTEDENFSVSIVNPRATENSSAYYAAYSGKNISLSTSGDYERYHEINGFYYSHIIDSSSGVPINKPIENSQNGLCSITIFGQSAGLIDCLTTAFISDIEKAQNFFEQKGGYQYVMVESSRLNVYTNIEDLELLDDNFSLQD